MGSRKAERRPGRTEDAGEFLLPAHCHATGRFGSRTVERAGREENVAARYRCAEVKTVVPGSKFTC